MGTSNLLWTLVARLGLNDSDCSKQAGIRRVQESWDTPDADDGAMR